MNVSHYKKTITIVTLSLLGFGFFVIGDVYAQSVVDNDSISITARVVGCGDNVVDVSLGEQCEGPNLAIKDLNGQSCSSLGYDSGTLSCGNTCIFDVSSCSHSGGGSSSGGSSSGSKKRNLGSGKKVNSSNLIFSGTSKPGDVIIVLNKGGFFTSGIADPKGNFVISLSIFDSGDYDFTFYASSELFGKSEEEAFAIDIRNETTTHIDNIHLKYLGLPKELIIIPVDDFEPDDEESFTKPIREVRNPLYNVVVIELVPDDESSVPYAINFGVGVMYIFALRIILFIVSPKI